MAKPRQSVGSASMYVDLLTNATDNWGEELRNGGLFDHVLACRSEMLRSSPTSGENAYVRLSAEIAYDRALITLCRAHHIGADVANFSNPNEERRRLELALADHGVNLALSVGRPRS